ncbi:MAG: type II secretion system protein [Patescibacteria group bacterium]
MKSKGFTLIELLVVIAIIGILSSVVLASLNSARGKGADTAVKAGLKQIAVQAEIYYDSTANSYGGASVCSVGTETGVFTESTIKAQIAEIKVQLTGTKSVTCLTDANGQKFAISVAALKGGSATWCVDNSGWNKAGATITGGVCAP